MPDQDEKLREVIAYIKSGEEEKAGHLFLRVLKKDVIDYMMYKYGWEEDEAVFLLNDAYLLIQEKIKNSTLLTFNKSYVIGVCIRLGSKAYHRVKKK